MGAAIAIVRAAACGAMGADIAAMVDALRTDRSGVGPSDMLEQVPAVAAGVGRYPLVIGTARMATWRAEMPALQRSSIMMTAPSSYSGARLSSCSAMIHRPPSGWIQAEPWWWLVRRSPVCVTVARPCDWKVPIVQQKLCIRMPEFPLDPCCVEPLMVCRSPAVPSPCPVRVPLR